MSTELDHQVRRALAARAGQITADRLQPAVPPTAAPARRRWLPWWRSLLAVAAVLVAVVFLVRRPDAPAPQVPNAPAVTVPTPAVTPSPSLPPSPSPSPPPRDTSPADPSPSRRDVAVEPTARAPETSAPADPLAPTGAPATSPAATP